MKPSLVITQGCAMNELVMLKVTCPLSSSRAVDVRRPVAVKRIKPAKPRKSVKHAESLIKPRQIVALIPLEWLVVKLFFITYIGIVSHIVSHFMT